MKKAARYIAAILATIQLSAIVSCGENGTRTPETSAGESDATTTAAETANPLDDDVPALDFGGKELHVRSVTYETGSYLTLFDVEEQTGDVVFDTLYKRNRLIEDRFNMKFVCDEASIGENTSLLKSLVMAGDASYDLIQCINRDAFSAGLDGYLMPLESLTYLDLSKPYYSKDINEQLCINGKQLFAYSDECFQMFESALILTFNKRMTDDFGLTSPYELVRDGKWTYDRFGEYIRAGVSDLNGDGEYKRDEDRFGVATNIDFWFPNFWINAGELSVLNNDGTLVFNAPGNEKFVDTLTYCVSLLSENGNVNLIDPAKRSDVAQTFANNMAYMACTSLGRLGFLRDMKDDYGVLPFPKYDEVQEKYLTRVIDGWLHVVPSVSADPEFTSAIMEALASETAKSVFPEYYNKLLTQKTLRDEESIEMMELIRENRVMDLGDVPFFEDVRNKYTARIQSKKTDIESFSVSLKEKVDKKLAEVMEKLS